MLENEVFKIGDKVIVHGSYQSEWFDEIVSATKGGRLKTKAGLLFYPDGHQYGGDTWHRKYIRLATPERTAKLREKTERNNIIARMRETAFAKMDIVDLRVINSIMNKYREEGSRGGGE